MATLIKTPLQIEAAGNKPKIIREFAGRAQSQQEHVSIALMQSPQGWKEPGQTPEFDEYTLVLKGSVTVETTNEAFDVNAGQCFHAQAQEWVRYSTPEGAEYLSVCLPAFSPDTVHRDEEP